MVDMTSGQPRRFIKRGGSWGIKVAPLMPTPFGFPFCASSLQREQQQQSPASASPSIGTPPPLPLDPRGTMTRPIRKTTTTRFVRSPIMDVCVCVLCVCVTTVVLELWYVTCLCSFMWHVCWPAIIVKSCTYFVCFTACVSKRAYVTCVSSRI